MRPGAGPSLSDKHEDGAGTDAGDDAGAGAGAGAVTDAGLMLRRRSEEAINPCSGKVQI